VAADRPAPTHRAARQVGGEGAGEVSSRVQVAGGPRPRTWTLRGLAALDDTLIEGALKDEHAGVREQGLRLADARVDKSDMLRSAVVKLADDPSALVRFQAAVHFGLL